MFQRFYDEGLAQASFLLGCDRSKHAVVIDPRRDAAVYVEAARQHGLTIVAAVETHVHADFVSGARELAETGASVVAGPGSDLAFPSRAVIDGEQMNVGDLRLTFLHTPGHTPEHITIVAESPGEPTRAFTGDLLFVGAVGRPDLLGEAQTRQLADRLFDSLQRLMNLDGSVEIHPGHGAGSLCGAGIGSAPSSTVAREREQNALLQFRDRAAFVAAVLADLPETPPYFARMKKMNQEGPPVLGLTRGARALPSIRAAAAAALAADGAIIIDLRPADAFAAAHPDGAVHLSYGNKVGYWGGWVLPPDVPLLLVDGETAHAPDACVQLLRVGLDRVEGIVEGGFAAWQAASLPTASITQVPAAQLRAGTKDLRVLDVRTPREFHEGHVPGAINIPVGDIPRRLAELPRDATIATICEGGYRSSLAASLLAQEGFHPVVNVVGGMAAYRERQEVVK